MATPHVAGRVALLMASQPEAPLSDIIQVLKETALHRSRTKGSPRYGTGRKQLPDFTLTGEQPDSSTWGETR
ncbi:MAG: hypothetical protein ACXWNF_11795, partial [Isosphaeraceae bacterium]